MSEQLREALSAIVDGEASEFELRRVLDEMGKDDSLVRAWQSYHLIRQSAQGENVQGVAEMGDRIWAALDADEFLEQDIVQEEPMVAAVVATPRRRWGLVGGAVAAVLALGVFMSGEFAAVDGPQTGQQQVAQTIFQAPVDSVVEANSVAPVVANPPGLQTVGSNSGDGQQQQVAAQSAGQYSGDDFDYGPGFVPYSELSTADQARSDGYFLHHVQHQAVNNDNLLSFVKMISYPQ